MAVSLELTFQGGSLITEKRVKKRYSIMYLPAGVLMCKAVLQAVQPIHCAHSTELVSTKRRQLCRTPTIVTPAAKSLV